MRRFSALAGAFFVAWLPLAANIPPGVPRAIKPMPEIKFGSLKGLKVTEDPYKNVPANQAFARDAWMKAQQEPDPIFAYDAAMRARVAFEGWYRNANTGQNPTAEQTKAFFNGADIPTFATAQALQAAHLFARLLTDDFDRSQTPAQVLSLMNRTVEWLGNAGFDVDDPQGLNRGLRALGFEPHEFLQLRRAFEDALRRKPPAGPAEPKP